MRQRVGMLQGFAKRRISSDAGTLEYSDDGEDQKSVGRGLARCSYGGGIAAQIAGRREQGADCARLRLG